MAKITAFIHTYNDGPRIARALESLRPFDEILVIDHGSTDDTANLARRHGATVLKGVPGVNNGVYAMDASHDWIFCMMPNESISEALEASLFEWKEKIDEPLDHDEKDEQAAEVATFSFAIREETEAGWQTREPETRLINRKQLNWPDAIPPNNPQSVRVAGHLLRFSKP